MVEKRVHEIAMVFQEEADGMEFAIIAEVINGAKRSGAAPLSPSTMVAPCPRIPASPYL